MAAVMLATLGWPHFVLLAAIILLVFGGSKLPELARGLARGMRIFRDELHGVQSDLEEPPPAKPLPPAEQKKDETPSNKS